MFFITPILWALDIVEVLCAIVTAVCTAFFIATSTLCNVSFKQAQQAQNYAEDQNEALIRQETQALGMKTLVGSVEDITGFSGVSPTLSEYLNESENFVTSLGNLCDALEPLHHGPKLIFVGAVILIVIEMIIITRHHIFFERDFYETRLTTSIDELHEHELQDISDELSKPSIPPPPPTPLSSSSEMVSLGDAFNFEEAPESIDKRFLDGLDFIKPQWSRNDSDTIRIEPLERCIDNFANDISTEALELHADDWVEEIHKGSSPTPQIFRYF